MMIGRDRSDGNKPREWDVDTTGAGLVRSVPQPPLAATVCGGRGIDVGATEAALSGTSPTGFTLLNASTAGQTICLSDAGVTTSGASRGFPLAPGAAIDRPSWQDLSLIHAIATAAGADLRVMPL